GGGGAGHAGGVVVATWGVDGLGECEREGLARGVCAHCGDAGEIEPPLDAAREERIVVHEQNSHRLGETARACGRLSGMPGFNLESGGSIARALLPEPEVRSPEPLSAKSEAPTGSTRRRAARSSRVPSSRCRWRRRS